MPKYKPLYSLYKGLRESKYDVPDSYVSFQKTLTQPGNAGAKSRRGLYQSLKESNYDVPDTYEDFYKNLFVPVNSTTSRALKIGENPNTPTVNRYRQKMFDSVDPNKNGLNNLSNRAVGQAVRATNNVRKPVIAKVVNQKGKPTGKEFAITPAKTAEDLDREYAQETTKNWENELHDQMADADKDAAKISDMFKSFIGSTDEVGSVWGNMTRGGGIAGTPHSVTTNNGILENTEARQILAAGDYNRKRRELLQLEQDSRNGAIFDNHSFFRGMYDAAKDTGLLTGGASDLINAGSLLATKQDLDNGVHTEAGDMLMQQAVKNSDAQSQYGDNQGWMYTGGVITTNMAPFMVQIGSAGFSKGMSNAIGKVVQGAASKVALGTMEKATGMVGAHIANYIGKVTGLTTKAFGKAIQYGIVGAAQANTVGLGNVANDVINRYTGQVYQDEQGNYKFGTFDSDGKLVHEGGEDFLTALVKGDAAQTIEFATELAGGGIDAVGTALKNFVSKGGKKIINKYNMENVSKVVDFLLNNKVSKNARYLKAGADRTLGKVELNSIVGESLEEELGIIANTVFTGDNKISDLWDEKQQSQIWGGMLLSIGLMKGAVAPFHAYNAKQYYSYKHKLDKADVNLSQLLGKEKWEELRNQIDATTNEDMPEMVNRINRDVALGKNRQPVREYIQNLLIMRGYDIGNMLAAKKAVEDKGEGVSVKNMEKNQAYQQGRDAYGYDTHEIQLDQEDKQKSLAQLLGISEQQLASMSDEELEALSGRDDNIDRAIYDYQLSTARYEGVIDNARDQIDLEVQRAAQAVDMYTDKSRNTIRNATIKATGGLEDYGVYIINGNIATHEDGSIDISNSDDMILYYDPTTNTVEHADAMMFAELGSEENADEVRSQAMADAKEKAIKETTGIIDGVVEVGTQFKTVGADGTEHTYEVLADNGDGTAMITIDGNVPTELVNGESVNIPVSFEELQKMKDEYDQQRLQAAKAEREQMEKERAAQQNQNTEETQPAFDFNQILNDDGNVVLVDVLDEDGNTKYPDSKLFLIRDAGAKAKVVELKSDGTIVPHAVNKEDVATISSMSLDEYKQAMPESSMIEDNSGENKGEIEVENPTIEGETAAPAEETAASESAETPATEQTPAAPAMTLEDGTEVPMLEDGNPDFSKLTAAQTAELYDTQFGEDADSIVSGYVSDAKKALDKASNMTVKGKTFVEQKAAKDAKEKAIADAQAAYDSAIAIRDAYNERQLAKVEDTADGRKELIEKARRKFARLKSAVKDDAEAVSQLYRDTIGSLLHRLYDGTGIDVTDTTPLTAEEYVASNLGAHSLNYEGTETSKGVKQETGLSREDFAKTQLLAADGKGTTIDALVHSLWENRPSNLESLDTQDIRNALIGVLNSGFKASETRNFVENIRIAQAENILEEQKRAQENAAYAEQHKAEPEAELKAKSDEKAELKAKSEEKLDNETDNESNDLSNESSNETDNDKINDNINSLTHEQQKAKEDGEKLGFPAVDKEGEPINQYVIELANWAKEQGLEIDPTSKLNSYADLFLMCKDGFGVSTLVPDEGDNINQVVYFPDNAEVVDQLWKLQEEFNAGRDLKHSSNIDSELTEGATFYDGDTAREFKEFVDKKVEEQNKVLGEQLDESDLPFSAKENGTQQTTAERAADVEKNKVDDMKVVDNIVGQKTRKAFERLAKMMGATIQWQYSDKLGNGWIQETTDADGNVHRTIFITLDSSITEGAQFIFGHEMTHQIKNLNPAAYNELTQLVLDTYGSDAFDKAVDETMQRYSDAGFSGREKDYYAEEVVADAVGEMIRDLNLAHTLAMKMSHPLLAAIHEILQKIKLAFFGTEYSDVTKNIIRSIEQAYVKTANGQVTNHETGEDVSFSLRQKPEPKKKGIGYKVFVLKDGKLYPPMVANPNGAATPVGVWLDADAAPIAGESKTGRPQVKQGGKGTQGGSGKLAYRPGWHLGLVPYAIQFNRKDAEGNKTLFPKNFVFAEVEYAADVDYQEEARQEGINQSGKYQHSLAGLKHLPTDGYYMYRTNPNPETDPWVITGAMKVNRILTRAEQADLVSKAGREPQQIQEGDIVTDDVVNSINQEIADAPKFSLKVYHGSGADFTEFDFDHMGEGAGSQVFGWGGYVTSSKKIGKDYAMLKDNPNSNLKSDAKEFLKSYPTYESFLANHKRIGASQRFTESEKKNFYEGMVKAANISRNLYEVDIPEDNGSNYLDWDKSLSKEQQDAIREGLEHIGVDIKKLESKGQSLERTGENIYNSTLYIGLTGTEYDLPERTKGISKFLSSVGFAGIKYKAGRNFGGAKKGDTNYVIFKPEDMKITEHTKFSIKTYHGSQASFDKFDHSFMGSGEGAQAYGWGTYVSEVEGIAKAYAKQNTAKRNTEYTVAKRAYEDAETEYKNLTNYIADSELNINMYNIPSLENNKKKLEMYKEKGIQHWVEVYEQRVERGEKTIKEERERIEEYKLKQKEAYKLMDEAKKKLDSIEKPKRNLYSVDIPDDTGRNYIGWDEPLGATKIVRLPKFFKANGWEYEKHEMYGRRTDVYTKYANGKELEGQITVEPSTTGGELYKQLASDLGVGSDKAASEFLSKAGFVGVKVIAQRNAGGNKEGKMNYVIFDENNAQITSHTKFSLRLKSAIEETETNPSDAQKESGNYKKGHIKFGGYDYTIENPKGSTRSGKDADGKEWKVTMHDTYGYIRGKFGKDGDHLDMFINDKADLDNWDGDVFVVDQVNPDGSFDEHKVMYGYDSMGDAKKAYLANYSDGWQGLGNITGVSKDEFDKWLDTSKRKLKPFADYAKVKFSLKDIKPVGVGAFGNIYNQFRGNAKAAIEFLKKVRGGEAVGALHHKDIGDIDLVWGKEGTGHSDGYGLSKLVKYHPEVLDNLQEILNDMRVVSSSKNRVNLESETHKAGVRLTWDGERKSWLLTAFKKETSASDKRTDTAATSLEGDTALSQTEGSAAKIDNSSETAKENGEKVDVEAPKTFEEFLNHPSLKFSIKNEQQRKAAEDAYEYASKLRPNKSSQYALVDMSNPSSSPEYYEKKALADRWRRFYNKAVHNELDDVYKDAWGNYKLFDLDRPFADQVNEVKGDVPNEFNAPDVAANKNADNESGAEYHEYKQDEPSSITYKDRYKAFKQREANREKTAGLRKERNEVEDVYKSKSEERVEYNKQLMKEYMDEHGLSSENDIPYDVWDNLRSKSFEKYQDELDSLFNKYKDLDKQIKAVAEPRFSLKDEKTMFGMHNISIDKLRKAIKQGGFAAPSMGVVDSKNGIYSDYGEITLIPKAEKLAKRTGKNAGTFTADAWTPTYPQVERIMNKQGEKAFNTDMNVKLGDVDNGIYSNVRESWKGYLSSGDVRDGLYWHYLFDKGMNPETIYQTGKYDNDITNEVMRISDNGNKADYTDKEVAELIQLMNKATGKDNDVDAQREKLKARIASAEKQGNHLLVALKKKRLEELEGVENFYIAADFVNDVVRNNRKNGKVDVHDTMDAAKEKVENDKKLSDDFPSWLDKKTEEYGVEEMLYNGTTPSGKPKYIPNTIDNAVKLMKKQGVAGGYTAFGSELGVFIAKNSPEVNTLAAMKNAKDKLIPFGDERHNQIKDKITKEFLELSDEIRVGSNNRYAFDDSGVSRMVELTDHKGNEKEYLKKAYNIEVSDEWMDRYNKLLDTIKKDYKVFYFETKFMRPYGLDEFEKAIVPSDTPSDVVDALKKAGIDVSSYERGNAEDRQNVTMDAINSSDNIRFSLKSMMEKPEGWKQANKKAIHIAEAIERDPKFSLKNLDGTLIKAGTYFSGGGLVEEGLKGIIDPVLAVEYDEKISGVYRNNFGQHIVTADVRDVDPKELVKQIDGEVEYFHASPVCKNYSQAKSNHAEVELDKETAASTAEFINAVKPKVVTIENVKGYKDSDAMKTITDALDANGYTWDADVYNAADYGGYTNRERLIVRAVRDGKLPEKPKKMAHKSGWYEAVADIIPTLTEKKNGVAPWMDVRLKADGIDWRNIDKPLYVMGSAYADGKVPHAFADELLPTLRTKSGDVIVMPDGKVYRAMGRVLARVSGVSDDYKMPFSENLSHTIIGNGIPTQLTEHVIAPLLQNTLRPTTPDDGNTRFSLRYDQFEHDLNQWKKDNNLPKDAQRPTIPQRNAGESAVDFLRRVDEYRKQMALWKTAPTYEQHLLSDDTALGEFNRELQRGSVLKRIAFQDSMLAIRKAQEAIMKEVGVDRLNMAEDAYTAENRSHGKGKNEFEEYNNEFLQPLRKAYHQMKKVLGDSYDNVRIYMMAKHGLERDAQMAFKKSLEADYEDVAQRSAAYKAYKGDMNRIINDSDLEFGRVDFTTWRQRDNALRVKYSPSYMDYRYDKNGIAYDYSGLSAIFDGSDFEEAAHKLVKDIESKYVTETNDLWDATNAATKKILRDGYKAGMMSKDTYQYVRDMYSHYIPLRGWDGTTADQVWDYIGGGKGAFNQTLKTAHGRTSIADDPIAYIENMAESGILLNNKNWVKQHLMLLAQNHPTSLLTLSKAWYVKSVDDNGNEEWIPATPQITSQMDSNQVKAAIDAFEKKMEQMAQTGDATQKRDGLNIAYPQTHSEEREHEVRVMKDGEEYVIYVNGDPQLAQAMNNTRAHRVREIQSGKLDRAAAWLGRKMAAAYTSLSPLFIPSNYFRDLTMTLASTAIREDAKYNYLLRKNLATSWNLGFMLRDYQNGKLRDKVNNGNATPKEQMFYDFMMNGGETGFVSSLDVEDLKKKFKNDLKDLDRWKANPVKVGHTIMDGIEFLNRAIEDSNRFAVYMTSIQYGRSIDEAVNDAKGVTLNFNRKGTGEYGWQMIRNLYLFINPAVQSLQTLGALVKHHPFKFTAVTASWLASGVLVPIVNAALMSLLGGDDDKDKYWQFTKWDRRNNLIMWVPFTHEYVKIPLAQEFRAFYGIGDMIASKMMGGELAEESWSQYAEDLLGQVVDMLPLDPTGYDGNIAVSLMPNAIRPVFELAFNVDFTGKPLFKETEYNKYDPNFTKAYVGTPDWLVRASKMVNSIGNGYPDVQQNSIDAFGDPRYNLNNPAVVDHVLSSYLGGAYTMGSQVLGVLTKSLNDPKEIKVADIPLFSKFISNPDDRPVTKKQGDEFWDMKENHDRAANSLSKLKKQAKVDGDYSMLERFYGSEEYKQYKQDDVKVKKYEEDKKKERAEESGEEYRPHKLNAEDIYKAHATPKDDFEDLKLKQLYTKLNGFKTSYDLLVDTAPSQSDGYYNTNKAAIDAIDEISLDKQEISELKKGFLDDGKDAYNAEDMKRIRELRKNILAVLEKANKVVVANQKAKAEK